MTNSKRYFCLSDVHNIVGAANKRFAPSQKQRKINYGSFKHFNDTDFLYDMLCAPFHVADIFHDIDDMAWYTSTLISDIVDHRASIKSKLIKPGQFLTWTLDYAKLSILETWHGISWRTSERDTGKKLDGKETGLSRKGNRLRKIILRKKVRNLTNFWGTILW